MARHESRNLAIGSAAALAVSVLLVFLLSQPAAQGARSGKNVGRAPVSADFVVVTGGARGKATRSVTIHIYNARNGKALGSLCLHRADRCTSPRAPTDGA